MNTINETYESRLIQLTDGEEIYVRLSSISGVCKVNSHPKNANDTKGFPRYQVYLENAPWNWVLLTIEEFEKNVKPFILNL